MTRYFLAVLLLISLLLNGLFCAEAQSITANSAFTCLRVMYRFDYKLDSAVAPPRSEPMILRISNGMSCFTSKPHHVRDSVYASLTHLPEQERIQQSFDTWQKAGNTELQYSIFKEPAKDLVVYHDIISTADYKYQEKAPLFHWKITPVKQVVAGYECQQAYSAFGGRMWEAWFTRDIPVSEGPYKFYGLPGLMVKVRDTHDNYVFELLSFESHPKPFTVTDSSLAPLSTRAAAPLIKKAKFKQAKLNDELTMVDQMASWGNKIPDSMRDRYLEKLKRRNNPLELK